MWYGGGRLLAERHRMDANFAQEIEEAAYGETIIAVVVGEKGSGIKAPGENGPDIVQSWEEVRDGLDYQHDAGFGGRECHSIYAWTAGRVLFVTEYDGATSVESVPRFPRAGKPQSMGG
jgi:hypothetical protein